MKQRAVRLVLFSRDYHSAINFYCQQTDLFTLKTNFPLGNGHRNVVLEFKHAPFEVVIFLPMNETCDKVIGIQGGTLPIISLPIPDCYGLYNRLKEAGVKFDSEPIDLPYGVQATMIDPDGNRICLSQEGFDL